MIFLRVVSRLRLAGRLGAVVEMLVQMLMFVALPVAAGGICLPMGSAQIRLPGAFGMHRARRDQLLQIQGVADRAFRRR